MLNKFKPMLALTLGVTVLANLAGCAAVVVGGAVATTTMVSSDRRTVAAQKDDAAIEFQSANLIYGMYGKNVKDVHVNVDSYNGVVLLTGQVKDEAARTRIDDAVKSVANVAKVVDEVEVTDDMASVGTRSSDALLSAKVRTKLLSTPDIYSHSFKIVTEKGTVYLMGRASRREANIATEAVREVSGVQKVVKIFEYIDESDTQTAQTDAQRTDVAEDSNKENVE